MPTRCTGFVGAPGVSSRRAESVQAEERFTEAATSLVHDFAAMTKVGMNRTIDYLNWRFFSKPTVRYKVWTLIRNGKP